ncbi:MAG: DUF4921 family protein [Trueperaceae bacterium]
MPLFRRDPFGRAWVLLSPERGLEASDFGSVPMAPAMSPLSPGGGASVGAETAAVRPATSGVDSPDWRMRALVHPAGMVSARPHPVDEGSSFFTQLPALGYHELIVEHPDPRARLETMNPTHLTEVLRFYRDRLEVVASRPGVRHVQVSRNFGRAAGALYEHPYGQLLAVPVTDRWVGEEKQVAAEHYQAHGSCLFCDVLTEELALRERVVTENEAYVAFAPFASKTPFETWILPKQHASSYAGVAANSLPLLADILQVLVRGLGDALDNPPYNLTFHTDVKRGAPDFHWHIEILPRLTNQAGFDWGTGFFVNPTLPEDAVRFLREAVALQEVMK